MSKVRQKMKFQKFIAITLECCFRLWQTTCQQQFPGQLEKPNLCCQNKSCCLFVFLSALAVDCSLVLAHATFFPLGVCECRFHVFTQQREGSKTSSNLFCPLSFFPLFFVLSGPFQQDVPNYPMQFQANTFQSLSKQNWFVV